MAGKNGAEQDQALERELAGLQQEYKRLNDRQLVTATRLENIEKQLQELEAQALEEYGTADPVALERLLEEKRAENARLVDEYRQHIQEISNGLSAIEQAEQDGRDEAQA